jgi:hypothetical protein
LLDFLNDVPEEALLRRRHPEGWTGIQILQHIALVERAVLRGLDERPATEPRSRGLLALAVRRLPVGWRLALVAQGVARVQAPAEAHPLVAATKESAVAELRASRDATATWLAGRDPLDLAVLRRTHPVLGVLDGIDWIDFLAAHERRHHRQIAVLVRPRLGAA